MTITLEAVVHKGKPCVAIQFKYNFKLKEIIKKCHGVCWSATLRSFYLEHDPILIKTLKAHLKDQGYFVLDHLNKGVIAKNTLTKDIKLSPLNEEKRTVFNTYREFLLGKRYSASTVSAYGGFVSDFLRFHLKKETQELTEDDVRLYIEWAVKQFKYSISTHRQMVSAFKQFAYFYPACSINEEKLERPRKDRKLPVVLNKQEILGLFQATKNLKHRTILVMLYASGLRISELLHLTLDCFDFRRKQLFIRGAKGRKDRYCTIAETAFPLIKNYYNTYKPKHYFIENPKGGLYSASSVRSFLKQSCRLAEIKKHVTPHTLRHSYATHLLENGTDIRYIQMLLGHSKPETTMIYTHVGERHIQEMKSPLDMFILEKRIPDNNDKPPLLS